MMCMVVLSIIYYDVNKYKVKYIYYTTMKRIKQMMKMLHNLVLERIDNTDFEKENNIK